MTPTIALESPLTDDARRLLAGSDAALREFYPPEECFTFAPEELDTPAVFFIVARAEGKAVGCVAMVKYDGYVEVKRLYVAPEGRGLGIAKLLMASLELRTIAIDHDKIRLETGEKLEPAVALYRSFGYAECGPYGDYEDIPSSMFMEKTL